MKTIWIILIVCLIIIAIPISIILGGTLVMYWGKSYVEETASYAEEKSNVQILCSRDLNLRFVDVKNGLCYNETGKVVQFILENWGTIDVEKLDITLIGEKGVKTIELINPSIKIEPLIGIGHVYIGKLPYDKDEMGETQEIKIVSSIKVTKTATPIKCASAPLRSHDIEMCLE